MDILSFIKYPHLYLRQSAKAYDGIMLETVCDPDVGRILPIIETVLDNPPRSVVVVVVVGVFSQHLSLARAISWIGP